MNSGDAGGKCAARAGPVASRPAAAAVAIAVVLVAANLRPAITSVGPLLDQVRVSLGASATWAGVLTTIPVLCFAVAGLAAPALIRRTGMRTAGALAMGMVAAGLVLRVLAGPVVMLAGTLVAAGGIAVAAVLLPATIKKTFPTRVGLVTGTYTATLQGGATLGFALTPALSVVLGGWRPTLASWSGLAVAALVVWTVATRNLAPQPATSRHTDEAARPLLRSPQAWFVTVFFGLQAFVAFVVIGWLPQLLMHVGISRGNAGLMLALLSVLAVPISLVVPPLAARRASQSGWITALGVCTATGVTGFLVAPSAAPLLWTILVGIGMSVFSLALTTIALRASTDQDTVRLSGMAQGLGYLLAGTGPFLFGTLYDLTGSWRAPLVMLLVVLALQLVAGALAGRTRAA